MNNVLHKITRVTDFICYLISYISMATICVLTVMVFGDIILGNILRRPVSGLYEICQVLLTTLVFASWAYTQTQHGHIHVVLFINMFPPKLRFICFAFTSFLSTFITGIATYGLFFQVRSLIKTGECTGTLMIPYWPFYAIEMVAFGLLTVVLFLDALQAVCAIWDREAGREIESTW